MDGMRRNRWTAWAGLRRWVLIIWDGRPCHRTRLVREYVEAQAGRIVIEWLPAYAPEPNPVEFL